MSRWVDARRTLERIRSLKGGSVRHRPLLTILGAAALMSAGCGSSGSSTTVRSTSSRQSAAGGSAVIASRTVTGFGTVLVDGQGRTLYVFAPDHAKAVTCLGGCATVWPPVSLPGTAKPTASGAVKSALLGSDPNPGGGRVVTYNGWPLYNYVADPTPGSTSGEGVTSGGGLWYLISPSGTVIKQQS